MKSLHWIALILVIVGAVNWGLVGLFEFDLVSAIFGGESDRESSALSRVIYALVGVAGLVVAGTSAALTGESRHRHHGVPTT